MIDYSRTFWNKRITKKYIDAMAFYKLNKLHMHLTDDQGWRIEIDKYPKLTEIASRFDTSYNEPKEREGFYSKSDMRELIAYAQERNIEIIPEIEMPGHSSEVFSVYPELSCKKDTTKIHPFTLGPGIHNEIFCAGNDETFLFLKNVLSEIIEIFPSKYIHIGGDEAPKQHWIECDKCQQRIKDEGLKDEHELQSWFINQIEKYLSANGKTLIGWDEIRSVMERQFNSFEETYISVRDQVVEINETGNTAWFSEILSYNYIYQGEARQFEGVRFTGVLEKRDGDWYIVQSHMSIPGSPD